MTDDGSFSVALTGDVMLSRRLSAVRHDGFAEVRRLLSTADVVAGNFEATCHNFEAEVTPSITAGTPMVTPPALLPELHALGFRMFGTANNHAFDYGESGVVRTVEYLQRAGFVVAGTGAHAKQARQPAYLEVAGRRVALVAVTATFRPWNVAGPAGQDVPGRPGLSAVAAKQVHDVSDETFSALERYAREVGVVAEMGRKRAFGFYTESELGADDVNELDIAGTVFRRSDRNDVDHRVDEADLSALRRSVAEAARQADVVLVSMHYHEMDITTGTAAAKRSQVKQPARFIGRVARELVDAGAHVVFGHGPHMPLGIELHNGRPIFYSLGNFIFHNDTAQRIPQAAYERFGLAADAFPGEFFHTRSGGGTKAHGGDPAFWTSILPTCHYSGGELSWIDLTVVDLGRRTSTWADRGVPVVADSATREQMIDEVLSLSGPGVDTLIKATA